MKTHNVCATEEIYVTNTAGFKNLVLSYLDWEQDCTVTIWTGREDFEGEIYNCPTKSDAISTVKRLSELASLKIEAQKHRAFIALEIDDDKPVIDLLINLHHSKKDTRQQQEAWIAKVFEFAEEAEMNPRLLQTA